MGSLNLIFLKLDQSDLRNFKFKKGQEGNTFQLEISETRPVGFKKFQIQQRGKRVIPFNWKFLKLDQSDLRNFKFNEGARGSSIFEFEISETRPVGFKKFQIQEWARGSSIFEFEIS